MRNGWLAALALVVLVAGGCGGGAGIGTSEAGSAEGTQAASTGKGPKLDDRAGNRFATMWVAMDGFDSAETVSILLAEDRGYFEEVKISPLTLSPVTPRLTIPDVVKGQDVVGVASGPEAVAARDRGAPIAIVGSVLQRATAALIWTRESGIEKIADLKGKTIAIPGLSSQRSLLEHVLSEEGVEPSQVNVISVGNDLVASLVKKKAEAIFGGSENVEGVDLESRGFQPVATPVTDLGVPDYEELVWVARQDVAEANPKLMEDFVSAVAHGASSAIARPEEAAKALQASGEKNPELTPAAIHGQVEATVGMLSTSGQVDPERLQDLIDWMSENELIGRDYSAEELLPYS